MAVVGGVFVIEFLSSGLQILSKKFLKRKLFPIAPFHLWLQMRGWTEPTIVMRLWILGAVFTFFGVWFALVT
jgi:phospho-N-acetylmuramoyl-pentapeptide-transferase